MNSDADNQDDANDEGQFVMARFPVSLDLPRAAPALLTEAREAVKREYRDAGKWKRLRCRSVKLVSQSQSGNIYAMQVSHSIEFDWTWEGAIAFRPLVLKEFADKESGYTDQANFEVDDSIVWSGEVLEVDQTQDLIYVCVANPEHPPLTGSFYVRPYEFLAFLNAVFNEPAFDLIQPQLPARLVAAEGNIHPQVHSRKSAGLPELRQWWQHSWSVLWGPPGTGKTYTTGQQVAHVLDDASERVLVVSTTNKATDAVAISTGTAARSHAPQALYAGQLLRIGKGAALQRFADHALTDMLRGAETEFLQQIEALAMRLNKTQDSDTKAILRKEIKDLRSQMRDAAQRNFLDNQIRVVVATAFRAMAFMKCHEVKQQLDTGYAPFTTIIIDEAGLISRAAIAALSLLASRRVVLVGDPKQLAPISRISRILPTGQMKWLAMSGLGHLREIKQTQPAVYVLNVQRRMHASICDVVSAYQYDDFLKTAPEVVQRDEALPAILTGQPRTIWYVLDEDCPELPTIGAERGPGNRSWIRTATLRILERLFIDKTLRAAHGLFISPFRGQAQMVASFLAKHEIDSWSASTVHSQQGAEADIVMFDTVNAGSYSWPYDEWQRLINVALSRARQACLFFSSRGEMQEPYLRPLLKHLSPQVLRYSGRDWRWQSVSLRTSFTLQRSQEVKESTSVGYQISRRKELRPVLSHEQHRLCGLRLDGKPRLVRGVAGSGKTVVLANWLMQTVKQWQHDPHVRIWAVFANRALQQLISESIGEAWEQETGGQPFPWHCVSLKHVLEILRDLLPEAGLRADDFGFDYDAAAAAFLQHRSAQQIQPRCDALFIDEAQDMGPSALKLLTAITRQTNFADDNSRSVNIFYDNAQNIYDRAKPTWSELGLDMRGRSTVMKESFRSTHPITELAINVLYRLIPPGNHPDHQELMKRGLVELSSRLGQPWWSVNFNQIDGPKPHFQRFATLESQMDGLAAYCRDLIEVQGVQPNDIAIVYNGRRVRQLLETQVAASLNSLGVSINSEFPGYRPPHAILVVTANSFKGYDSEVVLVPAIEHFVARDRGILASALYVAMTRARSILALFAQNPIGPYARTINRAVETSLDLLHERPVIADGLSSRDEALHLIEQVGAKHRQWLRDISDQYEVWQEPIISPAGEVIAEPLFWFKTLYGLVACFVPGQPSQRIVHRLSDLGIRRLEIGEPL